MCAALFKALDDCNTVKGWSPKKRILMEYSSNDDFIDCGISEECYETLRNSDARPNENVRKRVCAFADHCLVTIYGMIRIISMENPAATL